VLCLSCRPTHSIKPTSQTQGLDVGPESIVMIKAALSDCKTLLWNGPMGVFEFEKFAAVGLRVLVGG
jgi:3-phosphoglycerate kinase